MALQYFVDAPHTTADLLTPVLMRHRGWWSRDVLALQADNGDIVLHGLVRSYHHKQLAQEAFRAMTHTGRVRNELRVEAELVAY
jgi:hypothetical protein